MKILITGAGGFIGQALTASLAAHGFDVHAVLRSDDSPTAAAFSAVIPDLGSDAWQQAVAGMDAVIHTAARVHVMQEYAADPLASFRKANVEGTLNIARRAAAAGVQRFIFLSSIKVNGEINQSGQPFTAEDQPAPKDPYGVSKMEAEAGLYELGKRTGMEIVVVRPPLVYGPGVKGNFKYMLKLLDRGIPLPLGAIHNRRSFVALDNLVDLLTLCIRHPAAAGRTFMVSDGEDVSTTDLFRRVAAAMGKRARLIPVPPSALHAIAGLLGKPQVAQRLCSSLQADMSRTQETLGWAPPISVEEGFAKVARWYRDNRNIP